MNEPPPVPGDSGRQFLGLEYDISNPKLGMRLAGQAADVLEEIWSQQPPTAQPLRTVGQLFHVTNHAADVEYTGTLRRFVERHSPAILRELPTRIACRGVEMDMFGIAAAVPRNSVLLADRMLMLKLVQLGGQRLAASLIDGREELTNPMHDGHYVPLHVAAWTGDELLLDAVLRRGVDVNVTGSYGMTALHWAVANAPLGAVLRLLDAGTIVDSENEWEFTPMDIAVSNSRTDVVAALRRREAIEHPDGPVWRLLSKYVPT